jgi:hypothetical protein
VDQRHDDAQSPLLERTSLAFPEMTIGRTILHASSHPSCFGCGLKVRISYAISGSVGQAFSRIQVIYKVLRGIPPNGNRSSKETLVRDACAADLLSKIAMTGLNKLLLQRT